MIWGCNIFSYNCSIIDDPVSQIFLFRVKLTDKFNMLRILLFTILGGVPFETATNYFKIIQKPNWKLLQYRVDFNPPEDDTRIRKDALKEHKQTLGRFLFDGTMLVTPQKYAKDPLELTVKHPVRDFDVYFSALVLQ